MLKYVFWFIVVRLVFYLLSLVFYEISLNRDTGFDVYLKIHNKPVNESVFRLLRPFLFYDSDYFLEIVFNGYNYDKQHAFFPGYPLILRFITFVLSSAKIVNFDINGVIISNMILSLLCSTLTIYGLKKLTRTIYQSDKYVHIVLSVYVFNPCGLYYASLYSESLFLVLQTLFLMFVYDRVRNKSFGFLEAFMSSIFITASGFVRSNGFLSLGYIIYFYVILNFKWRILSITKTLILFAITFISSFLPFITIQLITAKYLCHNNDYEFCMKSIPFSYGYLQKKYWDVYFMSFTNDRRTSNLIYLIPLAYSLLILGKSKLKISFVSKFFDIILLKKPRDPDSYNMPSYYLLLLFSFMGLTMIHFNSFTRILSSYPFFYLFLGESYIVATNGQKKWMRFWYLGFHLFVCVFAINSYHPM